MSQKSRTESEELLEGASYHTFSDVFTDEELLISSQSSDNVSEKPEVLFEADLLKSESSKNSEESQSSKSSEASSTITTNGKSETSEILEFSQSAVDYRISTKKESQVGDPNQ